MMTYTPIEKVIGKDSRWLADVRREIGAETSRSSVLGYLAYRLSPSRATLKRGRRIFHVWETPERRVLADDAGWILELPGTPDETTALNVLEKFAYECTRMEPDHIPWGERDALGSAAVKALGDTALEPPLMDEKDRRKWVLDVLDGRVVTDLQYRRRDLPMVFVALTLAKPSEPVSKAADTVTPVPGGGPVKPEAPKPPRKVVLPEKPEEPSMVEPDAEKLGKFDRDLRLARGNPEDRADYLADIERQNKQRRASYAREVTAWEAECTRLQTENEEQTGHKAALVTYEAALAEYEVKLAEWEKAWARRNAATHAAEVHYMRKIGRVYGYFSEALPRGVNGNPMLTKNHFLHVDDWKRLEPVLNREFKRRERIKV
jgi:hypothetical protein